MGMTNQGAIADAAERNKAPIRAALCRLLAPAELPPRERSPGEPPDRAGQGTRPLLLELASGTGQHAVHFSAALPHMDWQPSDSDPVALASIAAHRRTAGLANLLPPLALDVMAADWPLQRAEAMFCANMIHISPWQATIGLAAGAGRLLSPRGAAILYGPFRRGGQHTAPSNAAFDAHLQARDSRWGVRDLEAVAAQFEAAGCTLGEVIEMPANNLLLSFQRKAAA